MSAQETRDRIMAKAPHMDVTAKGCHGRTFRARYPGTCALSGAQLLHLEVRRVKMTEWSSDGPAINDVWGVFAGTVSWGHGETSVQCQAVAADDVTANELLDAIEAGCRVEVFTRGAYSTTCAQWSGHDGKFFKVGSRGGKSRKQAARYILPRKAFAVRVKAQTKFGIWR